LLLVVLVLLLLQRLAVPPLHVASLRHCRGSSNSSRSSMQWHVLLRGQLHHVSLHCHTHAQAR
jgi:hypothetical protein